MRRGASSLQRLSIKWRLPLEPLQRLLLPSLTLLRCGHEAGAVIMVSCMIAHFDGASSCHSPASPLCSSNEHRCRLARADRSRHQSLRQQQFRLDSSSSQWSSHSPLDAHVDSALFIAIAAISAGALTSSWPLLLRSVYMASLILNLPR